ncbi:MAG TPA: PQQ-dependent sugar dehydrogenase [Candidatus Nitrosocosmicus sp.]|nr:PQQ-dependent sugar dehydrogenase [Candidatus Nitrosocosmicus sp.]
MSDLKRLNIYLYQQETFRAKMLYFLILIFVFLPFLVYSPLIVNGSGNDLENEFISNRTSFYSCQDYGESVQCALSKNEFEGFSVDSTSNQITPITREPNYVEGKSGKAVEFRDKFRDFVEMSNITAYQSEEFSISFWVKKISTPLQSTPSAHVISHTTFNQDEGWFFSTNNAQDQAIRFGLTSNLGDEPFMSKPIPISISTFTNIAATFDGSDIRVYRNGSPYESIEYNGTYIPTQNLPIHVGVASYCTECTKFQGIVDDVSFYDRALTPTEIGQIYNDNESVSNPNGLVGHWTFNNTLNDSSTYKNNGMMLTMVSSMVTSPDGKIFISEKNTGKIRILQNNILLNKPFVVIDNLDVNWETGLLGLAIDPEFEKNHFVYVYYSTYDDNGKPINKVVRFTEIDNLASNETVIFDDIPSNAAFHAGGALAMGPDDKLYISIGDARSSIYSQSKDILVGKILRINKDGTIPSDNPFPNSPVYTMGHRNIFGIAFDEKNGIGIFTENGDALFDEINVIKKGGNYGFPNMQPENLHWSVSNSTIDIKPLRAYYYSNAPTQTIYYTSDLFPSLKDTFLVGTYTGDIYSIKIDNKTKKISSEITPHNDPETIVSEKYIQINNYPFESVIGLTQTPSGDIYYGGYHIYKLDSVIEDEPDQILFSLQADYPDNIIIDNLFASYQKYVGIDIQNNAIKNLGNSTNNYSLLNIKIPKSLLSDVTNVNATVVSSLNEENTYDITDYLLNEISPKYNELSIPVPNDSIITNVRINGEDSSSDSEEDSSSDSED